MKSKIVFIFLLSVASMLNFASAAETQITVNTAPLAYVMVRVFEEGNPLNLIESFPDQQVDQDGQIVVVSNAEFPKIDIVAYIKVQKNGLAAYYKEYKSIETGKPYTITLPEENSGSPSAENRTISETQDENGTSNEENNELIENAETTESEASESLAGNVVIEADGKPINNIIIIIAVIIVMLLIVFGTIMRKNMKRTRAPKEPNPSNYSGPGPSNSSSDSFLPKDDKKLAQDLQATQARLEQANQELNKLKGRLKNEEKIREIENRINAEKEELRRLRQGY